MKILKHVVVGIALLTAAFAGGVFTAEVYRRLRYPTVPRHEADVFFDIGLVLFSSFGVYAGVLGGGWALLRRRRGRQARGLAVEESGENGRPTSR